MAAGTESHAVGSRVPTQSNSASSPWLKPWEITRGCVSACLAGDVHKKPLPFGAISHLWQLPTYQSAPIAGTSSEIMPGACAVDQNLRASFVTYRGKLA